MRLRRRLLPEGGTPTDPCAPRVRAIEGTSDCIPLTPHPSPAEGRGEPDSNLTCLRDWLIVNSLRNVAIGRRLVSHRVSCCLSSIMDITMDTSPRSEPLLLQIREAFHGIELEVGISLHQALVLDDYGTREELDAARVGDEHHDWQKLIALPEIDRVLDNAISFFDALGMRFHLPVCLTLLVTRTEECDSLLRSLRPYHFQAHQLLTEVQRQCVRDVRAYVVSHVDEFSASLWGGAQPWYWDADATEEQRLECYSQELQSLGCLVTVQTTQVSEEPS